jgi:hypothetical protein
VDLQRQRALCRFYREEFERHLDFLRDGGFIGSETRVVVDPVFQRFLDDMDRVCGRVEFPMLAETLLRNLDLLSGLSGVESRTGH